MSSVDSLLDLVVATCKSIEDKVISSVVVFEC